MTRAGLSAVAVALIALMAPASAAGSYDVFACGDAPDRSTGGWVASIGSPRTVEQSNACGNAGGLLVQEILGVNPLPGTGDNGWWTLTAPAGTKIDTARLSRWLRSYADPNWRAEIQADGVMLEGCIGYAPATDECDRGGPGGIQRYFSGLSAGAIRIGGHCAPVDGSGNCNNGAFLHRLQAVLYAATVTIDDQQAPTAGQPSAPALSDGQWHGPGQYSVSSTASDNTGVRERRVLLEGIEVGRKTAPGAAEGGCGQLNQGLAYTHVKPCEGSRGVNGALTTTITIPAGDARLDGTGDLVATARDTGGTASTSTGLTVKVDTTAPSAPAVSADPAWSSAEGGSVASIVAPEVDRAPIVAADVERCVGGSCAVTRTAGGAFGATLEHALGALPEGTSTVRVRHIDAAGNVGAWSQALALQRDRTAPAVTFWPVPAKVTSGEQLAFFASATDGGAGGARVATEFQVDGGAWLPYDGPLTAAGGRTYRFRAQATDAVGNRSEWVVSGAAAGVDPESGLGAPAPLPALPAKASAGLTIRSVRLERTRLTVRATRAAAATGPITLAFTATARGKQRTVRRTLSPERAAFTASLPLPAALRGVRRGKLVLGYAGDAGHRPQRIGRQVTR